MVLMSTKEHKSCPVHHRDHLRPARHREQREMRDALREQWFSALAADRQVKQVQSPAPPGRWNESSPSGFRLSETCRSLLRWTFDLIMWKSFVWMSFACSRLETLFGSQSVLKRRSLPGKVLATVVFGKTGRSWRYIRQRDSDAVVEVHTTLGRMNRIPQYRLCR